MKCAWNQLIGILPQWLAAETDKYGRTELQELRLRLGQPPELVLGHQSRWLGRIVSENDLNFVVNAASGYSPWAASSVANGFLTAPGGHRIGLCGDAVIRSGTMEGIRRIGSVCIRVARDFPGLAGAAAQLKGSILLLGPPGSGKTTLLRDLSRCISQWETVGVVDERGELFPEGIIRGKRMDVLTGCGKVQGIDVLLRTMGPDCVVVDEITSEWDCEALIRAGWCGIRLLATAHAASIQDMHRRQIYRSLINCGLFDHILVLDRTKSWREEKLA